jgi:hypothetical protein
LILFFEELLFLSAELSMFLDTIIIAVMMILCHSFVKDVSSLVPLQRFHRLIQDFLPF